MIYKRVRDSSNVREMQRGRSTCEVNLGQKLQRRLIPKTCIAHQLAHISLPIRMARQRRSCSTATHAPTERRSLHLRGPRGPSSNTFPRSVGTGSYSGGACCLEGEGSRLPPIMERELDALTQELVALAPLAWRSAEGPQLLRRVASLVGFHPYGCRGRDAGTPQLSAHLC
jgi:hypothetical protein